MNTIAEKYSNLKVKSVNDVVLEIVEEIAKKCDPTKGGLEVTCGWWETDVFPHAETSVFNFMAGQCYRQEIDKIMRQQGFSVYYSYSGFRWRARTTYRLEADNQKSRIL